MYYYVLICISIYNYGVYLLLTVVHKLYKSKRDINNKNKHNIKKIKKNINYSGL